MNDFMCKETWQQEEGRHMFIYHSYDQQEWGEEDMNL